MNIFSKIRYKPVVCMALIMFPAIGVYAQEGRVQLSSARLTVRQAFQEIESQTGYIIAFNNKLVNESRKIYVSKPAGSTKEVLSSVLAVNGLTYEVSGKHIILSPASRTAPVQIRPEPTEAGVSSEVAPDPIPEEPAPAMPEVTAPVGMIQPEQTSRPEYAVPAGEHESTRSRNGSPAWAIKSNLLYDAATTINLGFEFRTGRKWSLDLPVSFNPWTFKDNMKWKHLIVQPEMRWWPCEVFNGSFLGIHAHGGIFNVSALPDPPFSSYMNTHRFEGWLVGAGISYGYHWILAKRWSIEATIGAGYAYLSYDKYNCEKCGEPLGHETKHYFGPTKVGVTLIFMIK